MGGHFAASGHFKLGGRFQPPSTAGRRSNAQRLRNSSQFLNSAGATCWNSRQRCRVRPLIAAAASASHLPRRAGSRARRAGGAGPARCGASESRSASPAASHARGGGERGAAVTAESPARRERRKGTVPIFATREEDGARGGCCEETKDGAAEEALGAGLWRQGPRARNFEPELAYVRVRDRAGAGSDR